MAPLMNEIILTVSEKHNM